jgi:spore coat polysaccharide biosynthesis protein SpsF
LPRKALIEISGKTTIERLIDRVKLSKRADFIVLCTTVLKEDDVLCTIAQRNGILFHKGSVNDKLDRWKGAAQKYDVEFFVTADGDDLFCDPELIDLAFDQYESQNPDFIEGKDLICGSFTYGIKTSALEKVCDIKGTDETEMAWVYFKDTGLFRTAMLENVPVIFCRPEIRMTLDYPDDLKFFKSIIEHFATEKKDAFTLRDIVAYLDKNPEVIQINQHLQEMFLANQKAKTMLVLKNGASKDERRA